MLAIGTRASLQGFVSFVGPLHSGILTLAMRFVLFFAGLMVAAPAGGVAGLSHLTLTIAGFVIALVPMAVAWRAGQQGKADAVQV